MNLNRLDIIVSNVPQVCASLERILDKRRTMLTKILLSSRLAVTVSCYPKTIWFLWKTFSQESFFIIEVEDIEQNYKRLKELGIQVLNGPVGTDWETEEPAS